MILSKSKIYELKLVSSLKHEKMILREFRTSEIPNWKRKRLSRFAKYLGQYMSREGLPNMAVSSGRSDLLEYYGDNVSYMRPCVEGNRPDLIDKFMIYDFQMEDYYDVSWSVKIAINKKNYGILFYIWEVIDKSTIQANIPEKLKKYLSGWEKMSEHPVPTTWD